jgi:hypothetical protein
MTTVFFLLISLRFIYHKIDVCVRFSMNFEPLRCSRNALGICGGGRFDATVCAKSGASIT